MVLNFCLSYVIKWIWMIAADYPSNDYIVVLSIIDLVQLSFIFSIWTYKYVLYLSGPQMYILKVIMQ